MRTLSIFLILSLIICGCAQKRPDQAHTREVFNARGLKVITSFADRREHTISILYGNQLALKSAANSYRLHVKGEVFKLVTFHQANNKYWYGSYINGAVKAIETLTTKPATAGGSTVVSYALEQGNAPLKKDEDGYAKHRIKSILSHQALVFPQ